LAEANVDAYNAAPAASLRCRHPVYSYRPGEYYGLFHIRKHEFERSIKYAVHDLERLNKRLAEWKPGH
jgi:hypothetical protein